LSLFVKLTICKAFFNLEIIKLYDQNDKKSMFFFQIVCSVWVERKKNLSLKIYSLKETQRQNASGFQMKVENTSYTMIPMVLATADPSIFN